MSRNNPENPEITLKTLELPLRNPGITLIENTPPKKNYDNYELGER